MLHDLLFTDQLTIPDVKIIINLFEVFKNAHFSLISRNYDIPEQGNRITLQPFDSRFGHTLLQKLFVMISLSRNVLRMLTEYSIQSAI